MPGWPRSRASEAEASPEPMHGATARPPQPREGSPARHLTTGPGVEGGGGWPMHTTAQPSHAEGRPSPTGRTAETPGVRRWITQPTNLSDALDRTFRFCLYLAAFAKNCHVQRNIGPAQREGPSQSSPRPFALRAPAPTWAFSRQGRRSKPSHIQA